MWKSDKPSNACPRSAGSGMVEGGTNADKLHMAGRVAMEAKIAFSNDMIHLGVLPPRSTDGD